MWEGKGHVVAEAGVIQRERGKAKDSKQPPEGGRRPHPPSSVLLLPTRDKDVMAGTPWQEGP